MSTERTPAPVISVIGAGITGLTTALALHRRGLRCRVYEKAAELQPAGAGIMMQPNAMVVLDWLGIGDRVRQAGIALERAEILGADLRPLRPSSAQYITDTKNNKIIAIHRARLQEVLVTALPPDTLHCGAAYLGHRVEDSRVVVELDGGSLKTDLLLGADGIHSGVRSHLFPDTSLRDSGQACWRGVTRFPLPAQYVGTGNEAWGRGIRFGFASISADEVYWFAVTRARDCDVPPESVTREALAGRYRNFGPLVAELIQGTGEAQIIYTPITDLRRLATWHQGPVCLLGDAAHATTPNMGQGGAQGVEDAYYVSHYLAQSRNSREAFARFEAARRKKVDHIVNSSWRMGQLIHHAVGQSVLRLALKCTPEKTMARAMQQIYDVPEPRP